MHSGQFKLEQKDIKAIPVAGGEPDLLKALQYLPGVAAGNEGTNNFLFAGVTNGEIWYCWTKQ